LENAFEDCDEMSTLTLDEGLKTIGPDAFTFCSSLTNVIVPSSVTNIGEYAFEFCAALSNVVIPCSITEIQDGTFLGCTGLTNVIISKNVKTIGFQTFAGCYTLKSIYFSGDAPVIGGLSTFEYDTNAILYYLPGTSGWDDFSTNAGVPVVLWNPQIQTSDGNFGVRNDQFGFDITGTANIPIVVEADTNLANPVWTPLQSVTLTNGLFYFSETFQPNTAGRFYRISSP
jgi:hypothetical protein